VVVRYLPWRFVSKDLYKCLSLRWEGHDESTRWLRDGGKNEPYNLLRVHGKTCPECTSTRVTIRVGCYQTEPFLENKIMKKYTRAETDCKNDFCILVFFRFVSSPKLLQLAGERIRSSTYFSRTLSFPSQAQIHAGIAAPQKKDLMPICHNKKQKHHFFSLLFKRIHPLLCFATTTIRDH
jgi:hypothetical protein